MGQIERLAASKGIVCSLGVSARWIEAMVVGTTVVSARGRDNGTLWEGRAWCVSAP
jgi:hypothetical protein